MPQGAGASPATIRTRSRAGPVGALAGTVIIPVNMAPVPSLINVVSSPDAASPNE
jgi:hypothetical protein